jgi:hypothetical protein
MSLKRVFLCLSAAILSLLIGVAYGQDWLEGGYVGSYYGDIGMYFTDPIFYVNPHAGQSYYGFYPGPYGVYPFYPSPYYSDFRLNSLAGLNWTRYQKNWSQTMEYAQTKSSFRTYPISSSPYPVVQFPLSLSVTASPPNTTTDDSTATIVSQGMHGYQVFLDGNYIGTEGTGGDPLDGSYTFKVVGGQNYEVRVFDGQFNYPKTMFFDRGGTKIIHVEPGTAVYI